MTESYALSHAVSGGKKSKDDREEISKLREELLLTKKQLYEKEQQLFKQHREIHKLKVRIISTIKETVYISLSREMK